MNPIAHLYLVLVPVAEVFRKEFPEKDRLMMAKRNATTCRVEFLNQAVEKKWQAFCEEHQLNNDSSLEYA